MSQRRKRRCLDRGGGSRTLRWREFSGLLPSEPFRVFMPLGLIAGAVGAALWPLHYANWFPLYPAVPHSRLMICGFVSAFAAGFLCTAVPRTMSAPRLSPGELVLLVAIYLAMVLCLLVGATLTGDILFLAFVVILALVLGARFALRRSRPPAGVVLAAAGLCCAIVGAYLLATEIRVESLTVFRHRLARLLLFEGFLLLPLLGLGGFLFPRFFGGGFRDLSGRLGYGAACLCAVAFVTALAIDAAGGSIAAGLLKAVLAAGYLLIVVPRLLLPLRGAGTAAWSLRVSLLCVLAGLALAPVFPAQGVGVSHLLYVAGFGLMALTVGGRVLAGHAGDLARIAGRVVTLRWVLWLALLATGTRVVADFIPKIRISHHIYAALCWVLVCAIWAWFFFPKLAQTEVDDPEE